MENGFGSGAQRSPAAGSQISRRRQNVRQSLCVAISWPGGAPAAAAAAAAVLSEHVLFFSFFTLHPPVRLSTSPRSSSPGRRTAHSGRLSSGQQRPKASTVSFFISVCFIVKLIALLHVSVQLLQETQVRGMEPCPGQNWSRQCAIIIPVHY